MVRLKDLPLDRILAESKESVTTGKVVGQDIAIIGMAGQLPGAEDLPGFWENLRQGLDAVKPFPASRVQDLLPYFTALGFDRDEIRFFEGAYLDRIDTFDPLFFNLSPKEASLMDPHQRLFLETAWKAIEDAGYGGKKLSGTKTGVYLGFSNDNQVDYQSMVRVMESEMADLSVAGNIRSIIASRVAYLLDLKGPALTVDTACSSALTAVHIACTDLRLGRCDAALAGGVKVFLAPVDRGQKGIGIRSSINRARTFDHSSDGTGMGEGALAILLKPLYRAQEDGDHIYAVIKGSAVNQDGTSAGITAPNALAQADVMDQAWKEARIDPETITYLEAHGTGTILGDPIEIDGVTRAFRRYTEKKQFCGIGSVKTNIGHLDNAAGLAGLIKVALALHHGELPANIHFAAPNARIDFIDSPVFVVDQLQAWEAGLQPRRSGVSAFGLSGTNCHVVLEAAPVSERAAERAGMGNETGWRHVLTLSAKSKPALVRLVGDYAVFLSENRGWNLPDLCYTANTGRGHYTHRLAIPCAGERELLQTLWSLVRDSVEEAERYGAFYGEHRLVDAAKAVKQRGDLTEEEKRALSGDADTVIRQLAQRQAPGETGEPAAKEIVRLCQLYIQGAEIGWEELYRGQVPLRMSLPSYPFEKRRCWVNLHHTNTESKAEGLESKETAERVGHPLVEKCVIESVRQDLYITEMSPETHWVLREHLVRDHCVVPGTTYLEMGRVLGERYFPGSALEFREVVFISPLAVNSGEVRAVHIIVQRNEGSIGITVASRPDGEADWIYHAEMTVAPQEKAEAGRYQPEDLKARCHREWEADGRKPTGGNIHTGPRWRNVKAVHIGENELLMEVILPEEFAGDLELYGLHPAMLDMAVNVASQHVGDGGFYLPFSYREFRLLGRAPQRFYSYLRRRNPEAKGLEVIGFDIDLMDEEGRVFGQICDYRIKKVHQLEFQRGGQAEELYYRIGWVRPDEPPVEEASIGEGAVLIFPDRAGMGLRLADALRSAGHRVIIAEAGSDFAEPGVDRYRTGHSEADYRRLCAAVKGAGISHIIHMMLLGESGEWPVEEEWAGMRARGHESLFYLIRALVQEKYHQEVEILCVADYIYDVTGTEERLNPYGAGLFGLSKVIGKEHPQFHCRCLDLDDGVTAEILLSALRRGQREELLAVRGGQWYVQEFERLNLHGGEERNPGFTEEGVYLITGGMGGLGLETAKDLATRGPVRLALINRTSLPPREEWDTLLQAAEVGNEVAAHGEAAVQENGESANTGWNAKVAEKLRTVRTLENMGAQVSCHCVNVADEAGMTACIAFLRERYGRIRGVIHAAGVAGDGFIIRKEREQWDEVLAPKMRGTWLLDRLTRVDQPDFFILFSSISSYFGTAGQGDYTAANAYLDAYAAYRTKAGLPTTVINWPAWKETGMAVDFGANKDGIFKAIPTFKAMAAFDEILRYQPMRVTVGELNYEQVLPMLDQFPVRMEAGLQKWLEKKRPSVKAVQETAAAAQKPDTVIINGGSGENLPETEVSVARIWAKVLGLHEIDIYANFYELGGDSILATHLAKAMSSEFGDMVDISDIFNYSTVHGLAEYIERQLHPEPEREPETEKSEEEMEAILERLARGEIGIDEVDELLGQ